MKHNLGSDNPRITQAKAQVRHEHIHVCWYMYIKKKSKYTRNGKACIYKYVIDYKALKKVFYIENSPHQLDL